MKKIFIAPQIKFVEYEGNICDTIVLESGGSTSEAGIIEADAKRNGFFSDDDVLPQAKSVWDE